ncbi:PAS domain-containing protein [Rhizobium sp. S163]|uniref:PAS domain-containing protein n=1 Tax=Rhizobium sp. S163 TaxID=3055039 RepID=UPI0025AA0C21|nr:PAS domain-containing protein [Rhizobium sp. S163]MDM9649451.1 PAS domain-containing protein [Rhizobium sp. S163]
MTLVWSYRPKLLHLCLFCVAYIIGCGFAQALAIVPGTGISIWPPGGLFIATLIVAHPRTWPWWVLAGCLAELVSNLMWFQSPLAAAVLIYVGNALGATVGAWLLSRASRHPVRLETLEEVLVFIVVCAGIGPLISATVGSASLAWFGILSQTFVGAWPLWWIGDATGVLIVAPLALTVFQSWHRKAELSKARWAEAALLGLVFLIVAALSLGGYLPFAYIVMPPLLWAAVRFEFKGAVVSLALLALITAIFTIAGASPFVGDAETQRHRQIMLQLFLAISAFSALIVAAISHQHQAALRTLRQSVEALRDRERELEQIVNMVPVHIRRLTPQGEPTFFNRRLIDFFGLDLEQLKKPGASQLATNIETLVHTDDAPDLLQAVKHAIATGEPYSLKYRMRRADGEYRWVDGRAEPLRDEDGTIIQWFAISIDIDDEVRAQEALRLRERELQTLIDAVPAMIWTAKPDGTPTYLNKRYTDTTGASLDNFTANGGTAAFPLNVIHPDDVLIRAQVRTRAFETGMPYFVQYRHIRRDGSYRWTETRAEPLHDDKGAILAWYAVSVDIHEMVTAQEALRGRERELSQLVDMVPSLLWRLDAHGQPTFFNKRMMDFLGIDPVDAGGLGIDQMSAIFEAAVHPEDAPSRAEALRCSLATGEHFAMNYRLRRADGVYRWMSGRAEPMRDEKGHIVQWYGLSHDIDEQTRLYSDIAEREARIRRLIDSDIIGIVIWDLDGTLIDANDAFLRMVQYDRADVDAGLRWFDMTPADWQDVHAREEADELAATGKMQAREKEYFRKDGSRVPVLIGAACFEGQSRQGVAYILDLTEHKRAEAALRSREHELSLLVDMVPSYLWRISPEGIPVFFNRRLVDFLGLDVADLDMPGMNRLDAFIQGAIHPNDAVAVADAVERSLVTGELLSMKWRMRRTDGTFRWMAASAEALRDPDGSIVQWYGLCHDIDDQLQNEQALRNSKQQLEQMIDAVPINILSYDPAGKLTSTSKRYLDSVGVPPDHVKDFEALARHLTHPDDLQVMLQRALNGFATGTPFVNRFRRRSKDGSYPWIEARAQPLRDTSGAIVQWYQVSIDIEDEMRAQEALRESELQLRQLVDALPIQIWAAAADGEPSYLNKRLADYVGLELTDLSSPETSRLQMAIQNSVHPNDAPSVGRALMHSFTTGETFTMKYRQRRADGAYRWINGRAEPLRDADGTILQWYGVSFDIDADVRTQEELRQTQERLAVASQAASLAELSASIAHEVNQPLAAIVANSHACHRWLSGDPPNVDRAKLVAERIIRDANSAADVVSRVRALFSQSAETRIVTSLTGVIEEARDLMVEEAVRNRVRIDIDVERHLPQVYLDPVQVQQVLINLIRNGMDAMHSNEKDKTVEIRALRMGNEVQTEVCDRGPGIQFPDRIFEPFFTTKEHGMGMGLAICRSIVESHGGRLWAENTEPEGAKFVFTLPISTKAMQ